MRYLLAIALFLVFPRPVHAQCNLPDCPTIEGVLPYLGDRVHKNSGGRMKLLRAFKTDGRQINELGERKYELHYIAHLQFTEDAYWAPSTSTLFFAATPPRPDVKPAGHDRNYSRGELVSFRAWVPLAKYESGWKVVPWPTHEVFRP